MSKGSYEEIEQTPILLENEWNQAGMQGLQGMMGQPAPQVSLQGLGAEGQALLGQGMALVNMLQGIAKDPSQLPGYNVGMGEIEKVLAGGYDPRSSPYYEGIRKEAEIMSEESINRLLHGQQHRGTLASTVGTKAEGYTRALMDSKTLQTLGQLYEAERGRMSQAVSQALGYSQLPMQAAGGALSGISGLSPLATYGSDAANQQALANAQLQSNWAGQQMQGYGAMADYGTYYTNPITYNPGFWDYVMGIGGAVGSIIR